MVTGDAVSVVDTALAAPAAASRACLEAALSAAEYAVRVAEAQPSGPGKEAAIDAAIAEIREGIVARMDGTAHGSQPDPDDCVAASDAQAILRVQAQTACDALEGLR